MTLAVVLITAVVIITVAGQFIVRRYLKADIFDSHQGLVEAMLGVVGTMFSVLLWLLPSTVNRFPVHCRSRRTCSSCCGSKSFVFRTVRLDTCLNPEPK